MSISASVVRNEVRFGIDPTVSQQKESRMTRYMLSVHTCEGELRQPMTAEEMQHSWQQIGILEAEMKSTGAWVFSGRLHEPETATVVRIDTPADNACVAGSWLNVGGVAFAGSRGITWTVARAGIPPGPQSLLARATDGTGALQTSEEAGSLPRGTTGYHR